MRLPGLDIPKTEKVITNSFRGLNVTSSAKEDQFTSMNNLCSDLYPSLSVRKKRILYSAFTDEINGMCALDRLFCIKNRKVWYGDQMLNSLTLSAGKKTLVPVGSRVYIFPDKVFVETSGTLRYGNMEIEKSLSYGLVAIEPALTAYPDAPYERSSSEPTVSDPAAFEGRFWLDSASVPCKLKKYVFNGTAGSFHEVTPDCTRIIVSDGYYEPIDDFFDGFSPGDGAELTGSGKMLNTLRSLGLEGSFAVISRGPAYMLIDKKITGYRITVLTNNDNAGSFTVRRNVPDLDFALAAGSRMWGCSISENRIYASRKDNYCAFYGSGSSSDDPVSFPAGTPSRFTGAALFNGSPVFFKEDALHKIVGLSQSVVVCEGVAEGCSGSLQSIGGSLCYKSRTGVCAFSGGVCPVRISAELGELGALSACAGACSDRYYLSLSEGGVSRLLVYDTLHGIWHEEDALNFTCSAFCGGVLYLGCPGSGIYTLGQASGTPEDQINWYAESADIRTRDGGRKLLTRVTVRASIPEGSHAGMFVSYDDSGQRIYAGALRDGCSSFALRSVRSDLIKLRFEGTGDCSILSLIRSYRSAGEI